MATAKKKKKFPGCLAHAVIGMFYSVVASQRQPQYTHTYTRKNRRVARRFFPFFLIGLRQAQVVDGVHGNRSLHS